MMKNSIRLQIHERDCRGISLVIVLGCLVFLSALVVAFLVQMSTELKSSKMYAEGASARILAQSATNIVMGQIQAATKGTDGSGSPLAWASQPGLIRTFAPSGTLDQTFKLYSDSDMIAADPYRAATAATALSKWYENKALYTDLNQSVANSYPILDPNAATIDGFRIVGAPIGPDGNQAPMPVKWLYVLANGAVVAPTGSGDTAIVAGAEASPIVGRIAFWTDDETCKVNINTASEGSYSDFPRATNSTVERDLAANQPVKGEYQRYPGHPATTSLSAVFPSLQSTVQSEIEKIYDLIPRVKGGGSAGRTRLTTRGTAIQEIFPDADRLYTSVDEFMFRPDRDQNDPARLDVAAIEDARFLVTANSRAPDVNLFNEPRVCIWPVHVTDDSSHRTPYDNLIAFCSTMRNDPSEPNRFRYYFTREDPNSPTHDLPQSGAVAGLNRNRMLMEYLRDLAERDIPGFGGSFRSKYGDDIDQILTQIFDYIRSTNLCDSSVSAPYTVAVNATTKAGAGQVIPIEDTATDTRGFGHFRTVQGASLLFIANVDGGNLDGTGLDPSSQIDDKGVPLAPAAQVPPGKIRVQAIFLLQLYDPSVGSVFNNPNFKWRVEGLDQFKWNDGAGAVPMGFPAPITQTMIHNSADLAFFGDQMGFRQLIYPQTGLPALTPLVSGTIDLPKSSPFSFTGGDVTITLRSPSDQIVQTVVLNFPSESFPVPQIGPNQVYNYNNPTPPQKDGPVNSGPFNLRFFKFTGSIAGTPSRGGRIPSTLNAGTWILDQDVVRSVYATHGDIRLIAARKKTPEPKDTQYPFGPNAEYDNTSTQVLGAHNLFAGNGNPYYGAALGRLVKDAAYDNYAPINQLNRLTFAKKREGLTEQTSASDIPLDGVAVGKKTAFVDGDIPGDWDNGPYGIRDGPFINKPDEGDMGSSLYLPYNWKGNTGNFTLSSTLFTPNRLIPSAVAFGSLPTGVLADRPWQTLLFRPDPSGQGRHPGSKNRRGDGTPSGTDPLPADHLLLDLFTMPVVEPYAISEPLSTAGKINMNYQIAPFNYIRRDAAIRAVLKSEKVISIPDNKANVYKSKTLTGNAVGIRFDVDIDETLKGFQQRFDQDEIFRSASEICDIHIVPEDSTSILDDYQNMDSYWNSTTNGHRLTGDNSRERPYATIYPRLTTKSNTFTIHVRAQVLKKSKLTKPDEWKEGIDQVTGEYRGSQIIERFVDPNNTDLPDYADVATPSSRAPISEFYKFRVLAAKQFAP